MQRNVMFITSERQWPGKHNEKEVQMELNANKFVVILYLQRTGVGLGLALEAKNILRTITKFREEN